jgi:hypothetical protein
MKNKLTIKILESNINEIFNSNELVSNKIKQILNECIKFSFTLKNNNSIEIKKIVHKLCNIHFYTNSYNELSLRNTINYNIKILKQNTL